MGRTAAIVWISLAACGRVGFTFAGDGSVGDGSVVRDARPDATSSNPVARVATFVGHVDPGTSGDSFTASATRAGDLIVLQVGCFSPATVNGFTVSATGWTFTALGPEVGDTIGEIWGESFTAIAPDTASATFSVSFTGFCAIAELGDEFQNAAVDAHTDELGATTCDGSVTTHQADDAIWAACTAINNLTGVTPGFTKGGDDGDGAYSEYRISTDPANTVESPSIPTNSANVMSVVALAPS